VQGKGGRETVQSSVILLGTCSVWYNAARRVTFILISSKYSFFFSSMCTVRVEWAWQKVMVEILKL